MKTYIVESVQTERIGDKKETVYQLVESKEETENLAAELKDKVASLGGEVLAARGGAGQREMVQKIDIMPGRFGVDLRGFVAAINGG